MPRINFIPPPIDFNDRGTALVNPIMANAMQLAETFTTEIPRIRMQQESIAEDKRRYDDRMRMEADERDYRRGRDAIGDQRYAAEVARRDDEALRMRFKGLDAASMPDAVDVDGDGVADPITGMTGRGGVGAPAGMSAYQEGRLAAGEQSRRDQLRRDRARYAIELSKRYTTFDGKPRPLTAPEREAVQREVDAAFPMDASAADPSGTYAENPFGQPDPAEVTRSVAPASAALAAPRPAYSPMQQMIALQQLDQMRMIPPAERARLGLLDDTQIEQRKMLIMGPQYPGGQPAPKAPPKAPSEAPSEAPPVVERPVPATAMTDATDDPAAPSQLMAPTIDIDASAQRFITGAKMLFQTLLQQAQQALNHGDSASFATLQAKAGDVAEALSAAGAPVEMPVPKRDRGDAMTAGAPARGYMGAPTIVAPAAGPQPTMQEPQPGDPAYPAYEAWLQTPAGRDYLRQKEFAAARQERQLMRMAAIDPLRQ